MERSKLDRAALLSTALLGLLAVGPALAREKLPCVYVERPTVSSPDPELESHPDCASKTRGGGVRIARRHRRAAAYEDGLAAMRIDGGWYYVRPGGAARRVLTFDNGPDAFVEGRVRSTRAGKVVYLDRDFREVVPPRYDWGWPFERGRALVCVGCRPGPLEGEHRGVEGGRWGFIDAAGNEVVPVTLSREEALRLVVSGHP